MPNDQHDHTSRPPRKPRSPRQAELRAMAQVFNQAGLKTWLTFKTRNRVAAILWRACNRLSPSDPLKAYKTLCEADKAIWQDANFQPVTADGTMAADDGGPFDFDQLVEWYRLRQDQNAAEEEAQ